MAWAKGRSEVKRYMAGLPSEIEKKLLRPAAREMAKVVADEARLLCRSDEVAGQIKVKVKGHDGKVFGMVQVLKSGPGNEAIWLEYGTDPHFITVDVSQRQGMSVRKINEREKAGSLVIAGQFVGTTVKHPGAQPAPFLRPAADTKEAEALAAGQAYINARVKPSGIVGGDDAEVEE